MSQLPQFAMAVGPRVRQSAFFSATVAAGVKSFTIYNHMYLPVHFGDPLAEYWGMVEGVILADHSAQRQIEITGPDALELVQLLTPREMSTLAVGSGRYVVFTDHNGGIINDAVLLRVEDDKYWLSPGDGDVILWAQGIALGRGLDVSVTEPDISPLQLQGPLSPHVAKKLFGEIAVTMGYYHCHELELNGIPVVLTRTGWSGELGYEVYLLDGSRGTELWDLIMAAGEEHGIIPACPSLPRSVEGGILSYVSDITRDDTPFTIGLERLIDVDKPSDYIGKAALQRLAKEPTPRKLVGANFGGEPVTPNQHFMDVKSGDEVVGHVTRYCWSPRLKHNIALVNVPSALAVTGTALLLDAGDSWRDAKIVDIPWIPSERVIPAFE